MVTRVALLGAGIGQQHLTAFQNLPHLFNVSLIVDRDQEKAAHLAHLAGCPSAPDVQEAVDDPDIDLIDICLPPHLHTPVAIAALSAEKHVICEKPVATSLAEASQIKRSLDASPAHFYPVFQYRWGPSLARLRHVMALGLAGKPYIATLETHWDRGADYYSVDWRGTWAGEKGGAVLGHAIHNHDLLTNIMGPVAAVSGAITTRVNPIETEDCAALSFEMANGALATSNITLGHATNESRLRFVFEHLTATSGTEPYAPGLVDWQFIARDPENQKKLDQAVASAPKLASGYQGMFDEISKDLHGKPNNAITFQDGYSSIELVTAIYQAARTGCRVSLPLSPDHPLYSGWQP